MHTMSTEQWHEFVTRGAHTGEAATVGADGASHITPVRYVFDGADFLFTAGGETAKVRDLRRDPRAAICVEIRCHVTLSEALDELAEVGTRADRATPAPSRPTSSPSATPCPVRSSSACTRRRSSLTAASPTSGDRTPQTAGWLPALHSGRAAFGAGQGGGVVVCGRQARKHGGVDNVEVLDAVECADGASRMSAIRRSPYRGSPRPRGRTYFDG